MKIPIGATFAEILRFRKADAPVLSDYRFEVRITRPTGTKFIINDVISNDKTKTLFFRQAPSNYIEGKYTAELLMFHQDDCLHSTTELGVLYEIVKKGDEDIDFLEHNIVPLNSKFTHQIYSWHLSGGHASAIASPFYYGVLPVYDQPDGTTQPAHVYLEELLPHLEPLSCVTGAIVHVTIPKAVDGQKFGIFFATHIDLHPAIGFTYLDTHVPTAEDFPMAHDHNEDYVVFEQLITPDPDNISAYQSYTIQRAGCDYLHDEDSELNEFYIRLS